MADPPLTPPPRSRSIQVRFLQYFAKKDGMLRSSAQGQRMSISEQAGFRKSAVRQPLQFALSV